MSQTSESSPPPTFPVSPGSKPSPVKGRFRFSKVFTRWWWLATLLVCAVTYTVTQMPVWMDMRGPLYESTALIEVKPIVRAPMTAGSPMTTTLSRQFINTQFEIIIAPATLELALEKNDLLNRLGGDKNEAIGRLKKFTRSSQRRGTDLIEISYRDEDALLARDATVAVYEAYKERRDALEMNLRKEQLKAMKSELQNKNDRVKELRKRLMDVAEKVGVTCVWNDDGVSTVGDVNGLRTAAEKELYEAEKEMNQLSLQINKLLSVEDRELFHTCAELPDVGFKEAYKKYEDAKSEFQMMKASGLGGKHPDIAMRKTRIEEMEKILKRQTINVRESLKHRLALVQGQVKKMKGVINKEQDKGVDTARSMQELNLARKEYETARNKKDGMEAAYDLEKVKLVIPTNNIIVHQVPEQAGYPVTKGRDFVITLGTVLSLPFSIGLGILLMYLAEVIFPRRG